MQSETQLTDVVLHQTLDAAPDGILVVDEQGEIVFVNPMVEQLFEYTAEELLGTSVDRLLPANVRGQHAGRRQEYVNHPRSRSMGTGLDLRGRRQSGAEFPLEISLSPLRTETGLLVVVIIRDVTERRAAEEELQRAHRVLALVDDRERIARDLHDTVIQRLFAVGLSLQAALTRIDRKDPAIGRIQLAVDEIDLTIRDIRSSIFALHTRRPVTGSLRDDILAIGREAERALGFEPTMSFDGPVDALATDEIREHVLATVREALSNVTKHARATRVSVEVVVDPQALCLRVRDDGVGVEPGRRGRGNGLENMSERAESFGGHCEISRATSDGGTQLEWSVPLTSEPA